MADSVETVKVVADVPGGFKVINKSDMKESDKIFGKQDKPVTKKRSYTKRK